MMCSVEYWWEVGRKSWVNKTTGEVLKEGEISEEDRQEHLQLEVDFRVVKNTANT